MMSCNISGFLLCALCSRLIFHQVVSIRFLPCGAFPFLAKSKNSVVGQNKPPCPVPLGVLHHERVWQYLKPQASITSKASFRYFCVVHKYKSQSSAANFSMGNRLISHTVIVLYGIGLFCVWFGLSEGVPHFPYFQGGSATMVAYPP